MTKRGDKRANSSRDGDDDDTDDDEDEEEDGSDGANGVGNGGERSGATLKSMAAVDAVMTRGVSASKSRLNVATES